MNGLVSGLQGMEQGSQVCRQQAVAVFGSTGSIGKSTLDVLERNHARYRVGALTANTDVELLFEQCKKFQPATAAMVDPEAAAELSRRLSQAASKTTVSSGADALTAIASDSEIDIVMAAIVGFAGLAPTLEAAHSGKKILLANKESMVVAGELLTQAVAAGGASIIPVDSEHNAIFQCLPEQAQHNPGAGAHKGVTSLVLTASGGPFRSYTREQLDSVGIEQALSHPNWSMGPKVSIDSATLMNKGLEVIEASYLFGLDESLIEVVVHPQSTIHSMVRYSDGSVLAQLGLPDMRTPIANALAWPDRIDAGVEPLDFMKLGSLDFEAPDHQRFPCLALAREALRSGAGGPAVLNAANEIAVQEFLAGRISFMDIPAVNSFALRNMQVDKPASVTALHHVDQTARQIALDYIAQKVSIPVS